MLKRLSTLPRRHPKLHFSRIGCCNSNHTERESTGDVTESVGTVVGDSWPEWEAFIHRLSEEGYTESDHIGEGKYSNKIRTACLNFARDRFDFIRNFSNEDLKALVTAGCPTLDRKVVNSGKRLRAHLGIDEGSVCKSCYLRGNCERAYVKPLVNQGARTVDVMRFLLTYGLDSVTTSLEDKPQLKVKLEESARRLMKQMTEFSLQKADSDSWNSSPRQSSSMCENFIPQRKDQRSIPIKQGDWICPECNFINFARNIKCLSCNGLFEERLKNLGEHQDHLPLKKGDWLCDKCNFLNFAKNSRCLRCQEMPPKRKLSPGEWECDSCNFINFRKNMICLKCDHRRNNSSKAADNSTEALSRSAVYETFHTQEEKWNGFSKKQSQCKDARVWKFCEDERNGCGDLQPSTKKCVVSRSTIIKGDQYMNNYERKITDGTKCNLAKAESDIDRPVLLGKKAFDFNELADDDMSDWFGLRRKV